MRYVIAPKSQAVPAGFDPRTHRTVKDSLVLNEVEVISNSTLEGDFDQRAEELQAEVFPDANTLKRFIGDTLTHL